MTGSITSARFATLGAWTMLRAQRKAYRRTPTSLQPSPVSSGRASVSSQLDSSHPLDYLFLSECETGSVSVSGHDSFSNSEISLEQKSTDDCHQGHRPLASLHKFFFLVPLSH
ncbi:hypothetical protein fugu_009253 [Takifugu bimaculatus]|uniref:Uncharacterized protein n=1 Tax=Takifugu bimaculatus TaxID=433685 RepID=A0A4Z2AZL5_9TELE|nr:hypothetical protein fugu_009253 [Takifugu bimaculatus]